MYDVHFKLEGEMSNMSKPLNHVRKFMLCTGQVKTLDELIDYPKSHIIGEITTVGLFRLKRKFTALALYEDSVKINNVPEVLPEIRTYQIGLATFTKCTLCRRRRNWSETRASLARRMEVFEAEPITGL